MKTHAWKGLAQQQGRNHFLWIPVDRNKLSLKAMLMRISESQEQNGATGICKFTLNDSRRDKNLNPPKRRDIYLISQEFHEIGFQKHHESFFSSITFPFPYIKFKFLLL